METAETKVQTLCSELKIPSPVEFLTRIMGGTDPRRVSSVYLKIKELESEYGTEPPDEYDWLDLVELIKQEYRGSIVEISKSQDAAKQLMEYMHPKRKAIEMTQVAQVVDSTKLTRREIKNLRKAFDLDF